MAKDPIEKEFEDAIRSLGEVHGNMSVLSKLDSVLRNYNSDLSEAEALIQSDGAISGTIVQLANSPLYGANEKSDSVAVALQKIGYNQATKLVGMALSKQVFMRDLKSYGVTADTYWRHSYFTATFMEKVAKTSGLDCDEAYLLGLLHSIGRVVINELLLSREIEVYWDRFIPEENWETMTIGFTNPKAGATLLRIWNFPESLYKRVTAQNSMKAVKADSMLSLLDYARSLSLNLIDPKRLATLCESGAHPAQKRLKLSPSELSDQIAETETLVEEVYANLKEC